MLLWIAMGMESWFSTSFFIHSLFPGFYTGLSTWLSTACGMKHNRAVAYAGKGSPARIYLHGGAAGLPNRFLGEEVPGHRDDGLHGCRYAQIARGKDHIVGGEIIDIAPEAHSRVVGAFLVDLLDLPDGFRVILMLLLHHGFDPRFQGADEADVQRGRKDEVGAASEDDDMALLGEGSEHKGEVFAERGLFQDTQPHREVDHVLNPGS